MPAAATCPSAEQLGQFAAGKLTDQEARSLESHLLSCQACVQMLSAAECEVRPGRLASPPALSTGEAELLDRVANAALAALVDTAARGRASTTAFTSDQPTPFVPQDADLLELKAVFDPPARLGQLGVFAGYQIVRLIGAGGMGLVFEAEDPRLRRRVALKVLRPKMGRDPAVQARLLREARAEAALESDHVVSVFEVGESKGIPYLTMPLLAGETLERRLTSVGKYGAAAALPIARQIALALAAAHDAGLIHRDLKPANVWLERRSDRVKLLDFGIAHSGDEAGLTQEGMIVGTLAYMSPEQAQAHEVDPRSDLYSLGSILVHMLSGRPPHAGGSPSEVLASILSASPRSLKDIVPQVPQDVARLVQGLTARDPAERPASAREVVAEIDRIVARLTAGDSSATPPPTVLKPVRKVSPPWLWIAGGLLGLAAAVWGVIIALQTPHGTLLIEAAAGVEVRAGDQVATIRDQQSGQEYKVTVGENQLRPGVYFVVENAKTGLRFQAGEDGKFEITDGNATRAKVSLVPPMPPAVVNNKPTPEPQPAAPPPDRAKPFVLVRAGGEKEEYLHLTEALAVLDDGDAIEVHGNGPFMLGRIELAGKLILRAAPGYRPAFFTAPQIGEPWFSLGDKELSVSGCDFFFDNTLVLQGGGDWELKNCRFMGAGRICNHLGPRLSIADCLLYSSHELLAPFCIFSPGDAVELSNCILLHNAAFFELSGSGGQSLRLTNCLLRGNGGTSSLFQFVLAEADFKPATVTAAGNIFETNGPLLAPSVADWQTKVRWQGHDNLYAQVALTLPQPEGTPAKPSLAEWARFWGHEREEEGSLVAARPLVYRWNEFRFLPAASSLDAIRGEVEKVRKECGLDANFGPDWSLVGPGDAYVRALAAEGKPVPKDQLRPQAPVGGPIVLLRPGEPPRGFLTLEASSADLADGDTIEIRSDGPLAGCSIRNPPFDARLTLRSAPGYRPVITSDIGFRRRLTIEGLHLQNAHLTDEGYGQLVRAANCSLSGGADFGFTCCGGPERVIARCSLPFLYTVLKPGDKLSVVHSVVETFQFDPQADQGEAALVIDRCAIYNPLDGHYGQGTNFGGHPLVCKVRVDVRRSLLEAGGSYQIYPGEVFERELAGWTGTGNVYRQATPGFLARLKEKWQSAEEGSHELRPQIADPRAWQLAPASPTRAGRDFGPNTNRLPQ